MKKLCRNLVFTKTPLKGGFVLDKRIQIYPCPYPNAPRSNRCDYPVVLEFWIDDKDNPAIDPPFDEFKDLIGSGANQQARALRLTRLLSAVTNHRFALNEHPRVRWGWHLPEGKADINLNEQPSVTFMDWYTYPQMRGDLAIEQMTTPSVAPLSLLDHKEYYFKDPYEGNEREITFSEETWRLLHNYHAMDATSRKVVDSVAHLICNGIDLRYTMRSLSFLALVSSIETLCNYHYSKDKSNNCTECGQPRYNVHKKFKAFLRTFSGGHPESLEKYTRIYKMRSKIVHKGALLLGDEQFLWAKDAQHDEESHVHLETLQIARFALANWMVMSGKPSDKPLAA